MPTRPMEPWERDYPYRLPIWRASWPLSPNNRPDPKAQGEASPEQVYRRAQISAAYQLERIARSFMRGEQCTGILGDKRLRIVDHASTPRDMCRLWDVQPRTPEVQALVDRAVGCWRQCVERGVTVFEYDRPGYDEVTRSFQPLLRYASDPSVTPVVLEWDPEYHGESAISTDEAEAVDEDAPSPPPTGPPAPPAPRTPAALPARGGTRRQVGLLVVGILLIVAGILMRAR